MKFDKMSIEELHKLYIDIIPTLKYNYDLIVGRGSMEQLTDNLENSILEVIK
jgi:hypothetical protein